jgi:hypothetical protein
MAFLLLVNIPVLIMPAMGIKAHFDGLRLATGQIKRVRGAIITRDMADAVDLIRSKTPEGGYIFAGNTAHDRVVFNAPALYFLSGRKSATEYFTFDPGVVDTRPAQEQIIKEILEKNVKDIVLFAGNKTLNEPNMTSKSGGCFELDNFIRDSYAMIRQFGIYSVWELKKAAQAGPGSAGK